LSFTRHHRPDIFIEQLIFGIPKEIFDDDFYCSSKRVQWVAI
jgi:hypothetical protein